MTETLWGILGIALAIPLGVATNLLTPWCQAKIATSSSSLKGKTTLRQQREVAFIQWLARNPHALTAHLINQRTRAIVGSIALVLIYVVNFGLFAWPASIVRSLIASALSLAVVPLVFSLTQYIRRTRRIWEGVLKENDWVAWDLTKWSTDLQRWVPIETSPPSADGTQDLGKPS